MVPVEPVALVAKNLVASYYRLISCSENEKFHRGVVFEIQIPSQHVTPHTFAQVLDVFVILYH